MKIITRAIALVMVIATFATLMVACGKKEEEKPTENYVNNDLVGTWEGTESNEKDEAACTWVFNSDHTCTLNGGVDKLDNVSGTYTIEDLDNGKIKIKLDTWDKEKKGTFTVTETKLLLTVEFVNEYDCKRK